MTRPKPDLRPVADRRAEAAAQYKKGDKLYVYSVQGRISPALYELTIVGIGSKEVRISDPRMSWVRRVPLELVSRFYARTPLDALLRWRDSALDAIVESRRQIKEWEEQVEVATREIAAEQKKRGYEL